MISNTPSWKEKVDPAFDKFIKFYLEFLTISQLPGNKGYLALYDRNLRTLEIEGFPSLASVYEHDNAREAFVDLSIIMDEPLTEEQLREIKKEVKKVKNIFSLMIELAEIMQEESKKYYLKAFEIFSSEETYNKYTSGREETEVKERIKKAAGDAISFWFNWLVIPSENIKEEIRKSVQLRNFKYSTRMIKRNLFYTWDAISIMVNPKSADRKDIPVDTSPSRHYRN